MPEKLPNSQEKFEEEAKKDFKKIIEKNSEYESTLNDIDSILKTAGDSDATRKIIKEKWVSPAKEARKELEELKTVFIEKYGKESFSRSWDEFTLSRLPSGKEADIEQAERFGRYSDIELDFGIIEPLGLSDEAKENLMRRIREEEHNSENSI